MLEGGFYKNFHTRSSFFMLFHTTLNFLCSLFLFVLLYFLYPWEFYFISTFILLSTFKATYKNSEQTFYIA